MKVTLLNYTSNAMDLLIFTKQTRLTLSPGLYEEIRHWTEDSKLNELQYMAKTIPSSWEFVDYVFLIEDVSRAYTHQQVRTRSASYAQQSMRVTNMAEFKYVFTDANQHSPGAMAIIDSVLATIKQGYRALLEMGQAPEDARGILPTNIATNIIGKFNLRTMAELAKSRTGGRTQSEYIAVVNAMIDQVLIVHPWAESFLFGQFERDYFEEIETFAKQAFPTDTAKRGELLKIVDGMRKDWA